MTPWWEPDQSLRIVGPYQRPEIRTLLDQLQQVQERLQRAEAVVEAAKGLVFHGFEKPVIVEGLVELRNALAAWEEGTA